MIGRALRRSEPEAARVQTADISAGGHPVEEAAACRLQTMRRSRRADTHSRSRTQKETTCDQPTEKEIENRAYEIWERSGRPEGREDEFWQLAEQELRNEDKSSPVRTPESL